MRCSIVIPTHNRDDLLIRAVQSAIRASPSDGEIIVVDDKSKIPATRVLSGLNDERLKVIVNNGVGGASSARNLGVNCATGEIIFFLDDDDEIVFDYCQRVLAPHGPTKYADWGFSSIYERWEVSPSDKLRRRKALRNGIVNSASRVRDRVAAMSDGYWIRKEIYSVLGGLDPLQIIDEDTDLCIRLMQESKWPWYEVNAGMIVYKGYAPKDSNGAQLTVVTSSLKSLECYLRTYYKYMTSKKCSADVRWFLATRYLRRAVKLGVIQDAIEFAELQKPYVWRLALTFFIKLKKWTYS